MIVAYVGTEYQGFQTQASAINSLQTVLEQALYKILGEVVSVLASGRTDKGVHAKNLHLHFFAKTKKAQLRLKWVDILYRLNSVLPPDMSVLQLKRASQKFHSRYLAKQKTYAYWILLAKTPNPFLFNRVWRLPQNLNIDLMRQASVSLLGQHNFSSFCASDSTATHKVRQLFSIKFSTQALSNFYKLPHEKYLCIRFCGAGFLKQMVRIIVGTLVEVGLKKIPPQKVQKILKAELRSFAKKTAPACGLYLEKVKY